MSVLLSVCIPTYRRPECVQRSLANYFSIIKKNKLSSLVEICISDNNQDKATRAVVEKFQKRGGMRVKYHQNRENVGYDRNSMMSTMMGTGKYLHLASDEDMPTEEIFCEIVDCLKNNAPDMIFNISGLKGIWKDLSNLPQKTGPEEIFRRAFSVWGSELSFFVPMSYYVVKRSRFREVAKTILAHDEFMKSIMVHVAYFVYCVWKSKTIAISKQDIRCITPNEARLVKIYLPSEHALIAYNNYFRIVKACSEHGMLDRKTFAYFKRNFYWYVVTNLLKLRAKIPPQMAADECAKIRKSTQFVLEEYGEPQRSAFALYRSVLLSPRLPLHLAYKAFLSVKRLQKDNRPDQLEGILQRADGKTLIKTTDYLLPQKQGRK